MDSDNPKDERKALVIPLYKSPVELAQAGGPVPLPPVAAPSLEGLEVVVPQPPDLTEEDIQLRFFELARPYAKVRERSPQEAVAEGDELVIDVVGYSGDKLIPFSVRSDLDYDLVPDPTLPGFAEALVGAKVGESVQVEITLPQDYEVASLRGAPARFMADIKQAYQVDMPNPDGPELLAALGRGNTLEQVMDAIVEELEEELSDQLLVEARDRVLDEVAARTKVEIPGALIDEEIRRKWAELEGPVLTAKDFSHEEQKESLNGWLNDADLRLDAARRLRISLALKAIAERDGLKLTPERLEELLEDVAAQIGISVEETRAALTNDPSAAEKVEQVAWHLMAVEYVMSKAKVRFEGADEGEEEG